MADTVQFELVAPEQLIFTGDVELVVIPGTEGDFGVLPGHASLISTVRPGVVEILEDGQSKKRYFVAGGYAEVTAERCTVLSTEAIPVEDINLENAQKRMEKAEANIQDSDTDAERLRSNGELNVAQAMIEVAQN